MEKITKKKKAKKGLKKRIGLIAIGGLSLVLTICLSVGATLAWFAGSTWSSNQLYMGGPVYVEMAGADRGTTAAEWKGGSGSLDLQSFGRKTGTADMEAATEGRQIKDYVVLPGQGLALYSQARVYSTAQTTSVGTKDYTNTSSGADATNTSGNGVLQRVDNGRVTTTTTSVLRARFSISVEFDPIAGFNNFTAQGYRDNYPKQSTAYSGDFGKGEDGSATLTDATWQGALTAPQYKDPTEKKDEHDNVTAIWYTAQSRRDALGTTNAAKFTNKVSDSETDKAKNAMYQIKNNKLKSIYKWKFVSKTTYDTSAGEGEDDKGITDATATFAGSKYAKMAAPFDGSDDSSTASGYYGVWILDDAGKLQESDSFYKARCNAYVDSYTETYINEYGQQVERSIGASLTALEDALNNSFTDLVNDSSDAIQAGYINGMTVNETTNIMGYKAKGDPTKASWLYVDPSIGNDTNTNELSTSKGGWWYLVSSTGKVSTKENAIDTVTDTRTNNAADDLGNIVDTNTIGPVTGKPTFVRDEAGYTATDAAILKAKLFEIVPTLNTSEELAKNGKESVTKVVSVSFPFVNGRVTLPGKALDNIFANAKITVQISFQALQAFFPWSTEIDKMTYKNTLLGTEKALNIENAIPIYNEAFDY